MGLETGTYISDLVASNPPGTDPKSQGDDHIRLIKSVLQATLVSANRAFTLTKAAEISDKTETASSNRSLLPADHGKIILVDSTGGDVTITLPDPANAAIGEGWVSVIRRIDASSNEVKIAVSGSATIDGTGEITFATQYEGGILKSDGTNWQVLGYYSPNIALTNAENVFTRFNEFNFSNQRLFWANDVATAGPSWYLQRNRTTPAIDNDLGAIFFDGADSGGGNQNWASIRAIIVDPVNGSHDGKLRFRTAVDGSFGTRLEIAKGLWAGGVTGGDPGFDRLNFFEYFKNGQPLVEFFESTQQTIAASGLVSVPHGLTAKPQLYTAVLQCTTADAGYAVGDEVEYGTVCATTDTSNNNLTRMNSLYCDNDTDIEFRFGPSVLLANKTTGGAVGITFASWRLVIRAWRFSIAT